MPASKRDQLVDTAVKLFSTDGFHATGIDRILAESGVAKMTLYKHFRSKEELILAALRRRDERFRNWFMKTVEDQADRPADRLLAMFDVLGQWIRDDGFRGCIFINASAEFGDREHPIHASAAEHKRLMLNYVRQLAADAGVADPDELAAQLLLLMEGAFAVAHVCGHCDAPSQARRAAEVLIHHEDHGEGEEG